MPPPGLDDVDRDLHERHLGELLDEPWGDKLFFACSENARNLRPQSTSPRWSLTAKESLPKYDAFGVLLPTSKPPFTTRYSDMRRSLGYMDGALESGRYRAHEVAKSLGLEGHAIVAAPAPSKKPEAAAPPAPSPLVPSHAAALLSAVHAELRADEPATGLRGATSHLHDAIVRAMKREKHLPASADRQAELAAVRDFAMSVVGHASSDPGAHAEHERGHFAAVRGAVAALEAKLAKLLKR